MVDSLIKDLEYINVPATCPKCKCKKLIAEGIYEEKRVGAMIMKHNELFKCTRCKVKFGTSKIMTHLGLL